MSIQHHNHNCNDCGNTRVYHKFEHESRGDQVLAFCGDCDEDTTHTIGERYA